MKININVVKIAAVVLMMPALQHCGPTVSVPQTDYASIRVSLDSKCAGSSDSQT